ncbi:hypothetical protein [Fodinicola acaciae]|uniref:hypothetical protein n=1 Tax=Fodinicola acaciae TaxID=2681555 RepID=UPI003CCCA4F8
MSAEHPPGCPIVITGQPGAGKSTLLARAVLQTEGTYPQMRGVAFHAHGATVDEFHAALAQAVRLPATASHDEVLRVRAEPEGAGWVVAVDALDEVTSDVDLRAIATLLVDLARLPRLRVLVATRALSPGGRFAMGALLSTLGVRGPQARQLVNLDTDAYFDPDGLRDSPLRSSPRTCRAGHGPRTGPTPGSPAGSRRRPPLAPAATTWWRRWLLPTWAARTQPSTRLSLASTPPGSRLPWVKRSPSTWRPCRTGSRPPPEHC